MAIGAILGAVGSGVSSTKGTQLDVMGNLGNANVKKKSNQTLFNAIDYGGGLSNTINMLSGGKLFGGKDGEDEINLEDLLVYKQLPDYAESDQARKDWAAKLQEFGGQEGYGAIPMNWDEIYNTAKNKINRYYWGGVNDTGLAGKVKASAARRGVSQSPALENQLSTLGFQEAIDQNELATTEASNKVQYAEQGRKDWLTSLQNLASLKPQYLTSSGVAQGVGAMYQDAQAGDSGMSNVITALGSLFANNQGSSTTQKDTSWFDNIVRNNYSVPNSITNNGGQGLGSLVNLYDTTYGRGGYN
jgi:hypothetical protein